MLATHPMKHHRGSGAQLRPLLNACVEYSCMLVVQSLLGALECLQAAWTVYMLDNTLSSLSMNLSPGGTSKTHRWELSPFDIKAHFLAYEWWSRQSSLCSMSCSSVPDRRQALLMCPPSLH